MPSNLNLDIEVIEASPEKISPNHTLKNSMLDDQFKEELENVVYENSPKKDGVHTGKNREKKKFEFNVKAV